MIAVLAGSGVGVNGDGVDVSGDHPTPVTMARAVDGSGDLPKRLGCASAYRPTPDPSVGRRR